MPSDEIVDVSRTGLKRRRQLALRLGVPVLAVLLVIVSILGISLYAYENNKNAALTLSHAVLNQLEARIGREVGGYLSPATQAALIARDMVARHAIDDGQLAIEGFAASMLSQVPHLEGFYAANSHGDFIMVRRDPGGGTDTKLILNTPKTRSVSSIHLDGSGQLVDSTLSPGDDFDPRTRGWYQGALKTGGVYWSSPYIFYTTRQPGITASIRLLAPGSADRVFGVDITLEALSGFLGSLRIGTTGRAAIIDRDGTVIADSGQAQVGEAQVGQAQVGQAQAEQSQGVRSKAVQTMTTGLSNAALTAAADRFRVEGYGNRTITVGGVRYVTVAARLPAAGQDWVLLIAAPEAEFTALARTSSTRDFLLSLITIGLAAILGGMLVRQNFRADRLRRLLSRQRESGARETQALSHLTSQTGLFDPAQPAPALTESLAASASARRASIWRLSGQGRTLYCEDQFEPGQNFHSDGLELSRSELSHFFASLDAGETIALADASRDSRTAELYRLLMQPYGSRALSVVPVRSSSGIAGALLIEDAEEPARAGQFAQAVCGIVAMRLAAQPETLATASAGLRQDDAPAAPTAAGEQEAFSSELTEAGVTPPDLAAEYFPAVAAMIVRFDDAIALGRPDQHGVTALADGIARALQAIASRHALPYMKLTGHHLVAAAGCAATRDATACARIADAALDAREACLSLLAQANLDPVFRIGIDFGSALGGVLGEAPSLFNLWGDAIRNAELMAQSAPELGTIQVSESVFTRLRQEFLFRPRGVFYLPRIGTARTFIMAGRR